MGKVSPGLRQRALRVRKTIEAIIAGDEISKEEIDYALALLRDAYHDVHFRRAEGESVAEPVLPPG